MRSEQLYLTDIVEATEAITRFLDGVGEDVFMADDLIQSAVLQKLLIIGEAAARISKPFRARYPHIPWSQIVAFRNFVIHAYFSINWSIAWVAATVEVSLLREQVVALLQDEFPDN